MLSEEHFRFFILEFLTFFSGTTESAKNFTRRALYDIMRECKVKKIEEKFEFLVQKLAEITQCPKDKNGILDRALRFFKTQFKQRWVAASRKEERFICNNEEWLTSPIQLPNFSAEPTYKPTKCFMDLSDRSKRPKTRELREQVPAEELVYAAGIIQRTDASVMIKEIMSTPTRATKIRKSFASIRKQVSVKKHTSQEALAIFVEGDFTRRQWEVIHSANNNIYPCYSLIQKAKKDCYPKEEKMRVTETCIEIQLQEYLIIQHHVYINT